MEKLPILYKRSDKKRLNSGQALLIVLLSMSVVLAVVLSSVSKSVTDISITSYEEDSLRAFSAAEAGIEEALLESVVPGDTILETQLDVSDPANPRYEAEVNDPDAGNVFEYPDKLISGQVATFWFVSHDNSGNLVCGSETCTSANKLEFCWTWTNEEGPEPAVEIAIYYDDTLSHLASDFSSLKVKRFNFDPKSSATSRNFIAASSSCNIGTQYKYSTGSYFNKLKDRVSDCVFGGPPSCLIAARVRILDNGNVGQKISLKVDGGGAAKLPSQGISISSTGTSGESTRRVTVLQGYPEPPDVFEGVLFSAKELRQ